ncbi:MAG: type II toxin-antitoxin system RelB/DinJ family antitoxin [Gammaproteobacteria bacterium]|nr:type II toxin-antitoxin system RelB/DinJ family antitoxin [Gammaproteobacteria bacterium]
MAKVQTSLRIEEESLNEAKEILASLGMNFSEAVNIFTNMVVKHRGLPFSVTLPNDPQTPAQQLNIAENIMARYDNTLKELAK